MGGFGAFGKMPSAGDFFRLNTPAGFVRVWDGWLQQVMLEGQEAYGPGFDAHYMSAPIWRFSLPAGLAGALPVAGVMMPSVDRVGRRFPLTLMAASRSPRAVLQDHVARGGLFAQLEEVALDALEDSMTRDSLAEALAACAPPELPPAAAPPKRHELRLTGPGGGLPVADIEAAADQPDPRLRGCSLWSALLGGELRTLACIGLPRGASALGLFDLGAPVWNGAAAS